MDTNENQQKMNNDHDDNIACSYSQNLLTIRECFVYRIPPLKSSSGYRADEWNLGNPALTSILKITRDDENCYIQLFDIKTTQSSDSDNTTAFATCKIAIEHDKNLQSFVEEVIDSSRYFVLRCENEKLKQHAFIGIGFRERQTAFDFKATLQDFMRSLQRQKTAESIQNNQQNYSTNQFDQTLNDNIDSTATTSNTNHQIFSLQGQKIHLNLNNHNNPITKKSSPLIESNTNISSVPSILLPPPPPGSVYGASNQQLTNDENKEDDELWSEFSSA